MTSMKINEYDGDKYIRLIDVIKYLSHVRDSHNDNSLVDNIVSKVISVILSRFTELL
jgi:hypothetical protein